MLDHAAVWAAYEAVTIAPPPEPDPPARRSFTPLNLPDGSGDLWEQYLNGLRPAFIESEGIKSQSGSKNWSKNFRSPFREGDDDPSAGFNEKLCIVKDFGSDQVYNAHDIAALIGYPSYEQFKAERRPASSNQHLDKRTEDCSQPLGLFPGEGFPRTMAWVIMGIHKIKGLPFKLENQLPFFKVYHAADQLMRWGLLAKDAVITAPDIQRLAAQVDIELSRHDSERGLKQGDAWGVCPEFCENLSRSMQEPLNRSEQISAKVGRPAICYQFRSDHLTAFQRHCERLYHEAAFNSDAPSDIFSDWFDTSDEDTALLNELREKPYREFSDQRQQAQAVLDLMLTKLDRDMSAIHRGTYKPLDLPDLKLGKSRAYHEAAAMGLMMESGGTVESVYPLFERLLGVSKATATSILQNIGAVTVERTVTLPASQVKPSHQVISRNPAEGTITIKAHSAAQFEEATDPEVIERYRQHCERQGAKAALRSKREPTRLAVKHEADTEAQKADVVGIADTIPAVHSQEFLMMQIQPKFLPGIEAIPEYDVDRETGEILAPHEPVTRVNELIAKVRAERTQTVTDAPVPQMQASEPPSEPEASPAVIEPVQNRHVRYCRNCGGECEPKPYPLPLRFGGGMLCRKCEPYAARIEKILGLRLGAVA